MIPARGLPFAEFDPLPARERAVSAITVEEWVRIEKERAEDFQTPEPAAARRLPPGWTLEEPQTGTEAESGGRPDDWDPELDRYHQDPENPEPETIDIFGLMARPAPAALSTLALSRRYDTAMKKINIQITDYSLARSLGQQLRKAGRLLGGGKAELADADRAIGEVELRIQTILQKTQWAKGEGRIMFFYYLAWCVIGTALVAGLFTAADQTTPLVLLTSCMLGVLGASIGAMFMLRRTASTRNQLPIRSTIWYYSQPVLGFPLGAVIFGLTLVFLQISVPRLDSIENPLLLYFAAFTGGLLINFVQDMFASRRSYPLDSPLEQDADPAETDKP